MTPSFRPELILDGLSIVAVRLDDAFRACEVVGDAVAIEAGMDVRDAVPALFGMEDQLRAPMPDVSMPFVVLGDAMDRPVALNARRDPATGAVWLILRDVSEEAELQQQLVQQHNSLSIAQDELRRARDAAHAADRAKTAFLANVSHELRTPLHVVIGGASILAKPRMKPMPADEVRGFATDIHDGGMLLLQLVEDLIDLSRSETGELTIYEEWCALDGIVGEMAALARGLPDIGAISIHCDIPKPLPLFLGDARRIKQVLLNLLSNAVKALDGEGRIDVSLTRASTGEVVLSVADDGPGMSAVELSVARQPFGQPRSAVRSKGTGLGLAIVERLVQMHGGRFEIVTAPGEGLAARVTLDAVRFAPV